MKKAAMVFGLILAGALGAAAQHWPAFRGGAASGVADPSTLPTKWDIEKGANVLWKREIPGFGHASPIVWGDRVFVLTAVNKSDKPGMDMKSQALTVSDDSEFEWRVYALNKKTGEILWQQVARTGKPLSKRHPQSSQASSTPVTNGKVVVAYLGSEGLYAYDVNGKLLWKKDLGLINTPFHADPDLVYGTATSPVIYKELVIVQADKDRDSFLAAYSLKDGREVWRVARDEYSSWGTPVVVTGGKRDELVTQAHKFTRSYDPATGKELWRFGRNGEQHIPSPALAGGVLYFATLSSELAPVYAIRPGGAGDISIAEGKPRSPSIAWYESRGGIHTVSPIVYRGQMYVCSDNGVISAFDAATGQRSFRARLGNGGNYFASPVGAGGNIYFFNQEGDGFVVKSGAKYELVSQNSMGEMVMATPAVSGNVLFVRGYKHLFAIADSSAPARAAK